MTPRLRPAPFSLAASFCTLLAFSVPAAGLAQGYSLSWSSLDGGGGMRSLGGAYALSGTAGQADAGRLAGGAFTVEGGLWGVPEPRLLDVPGDEVALAPGRLSAPGPNPFAGSTQVSFALSREGPARLDVFDLAGQRVATIARGSHAAGRYQVHWDGSDDAGRPLAPGIYFLRLEAESRRTSQRVVKLR